MPYVSHGGERLLKNEESDILMDWYIPKSAMVYQYYGCRWHGHPCLKDRTDIQKERNLETINLEHNMKAVGYRVISVWECEKPETTNRKLGKRFIPYPYFIVYDFEAILKILDIGKTPDLSYNQVHVPVSVAITDNLTNQPSFIVNQDPDQLIHDFIQDIHQLSKKKLVLKSLRCIP